MSGVGEWAFRDEKQATQLNRTYFLWVTLKMAIIRKISDQFRVKCNESAPRRICSYGRFRPCLLWPSRRTSTSCSPPSPWVSSPTFPNPFVEDWDPTSLTSADLTGPRSNAKQPTAAQIMLQVEHWYLAPNFYSWTLLVTLEFLWWLRSLIHQIQTHAIQCTTHHAQTTVALETRLLAMKQ